VAVVLLQTPKVYKLQQLISRMQIKRKVKLNTSKQYVKRKIMRVKLLKQRVKKQVLAVLPRLRPPAHLPQAQAL
jgi:hypothetical protein